MKEKQQQLLFDKGITNVPSDALCSDNALEESLGMVYDNGEHRVIQKPVVQMTTGTGFSATILYIHKFDGKKRYIYISRVRSTSEITYSFKWGTKDELTNQLQSGGVFTEIDVSDETKRSKICVTSVGKTLIVTDVNGQHYYLWKDGSYKSLGIIPDPKVEFWLVGASKRVGSHVAEPSYVKCRQGDTDIYDDNSGLRPASGKQGDYDNLVTGLYAKNKKAISQKKGFCRPFFIRTALEMYDGSYTHVSQPILMLPTITESTYFVRYSSDDETVCQTYYRTLKYKDTSDFSGWEDVVKDVVVFISDGIELYDVSVEQPLNEIDATNGNIVSNGIYRATRTEVQANETHSTYHNILSRLGFLGLMNRDRSEIFSDIAGTSIFYKLCGLGVNDTGTGSEKWLGDKFERHTLENITTQEQLGYDDYFSRSEIIAGYIFSYNSRLNLCNVQRGFFEGFDFFMPNDDNTASHTYDFYVTIKLDSGDRVIHHQKTECYQKQGIYFYYPDARAKYVTIIKDGSQCVLDGELTEHSGLNGAYYFYPTNVENIDLAPNAQGYISTENLFNERTETASAHVENTTPEILSNTIITSEVNNPFVFYAHGYNNVGFGDVIGVSSITQALSEGQFGQYPLIVFATDGIWAMSVDNKGLYSSVHPMSREVCNNARSITQTDGAVFFTSAKGLMVVAGNQVKCVSEQLSGKERTRTGVIGLGNFNEYLKQCFIAYDYRDSLLWIFSDLSRTNNNYCWIYSIKSGTFGKYEQLADYVVNDYPDYLISSVQNFYSLLDRPNINSQAEQAVSYGAKIITRPMKLENALALKSIMQIKHIHDLNDNATLALRIFASNNLKNWVELHSLRGTPWKYYRFRYDFTNLKATDRFAGTMLITQERRTDKLR